MRIERLASAARRVPLGTWVGAMLVLGAGLAWVWLRLGLPLPVCQFRRWTGLACPTCGATRLVAALLRADVAQAFACNPLIFLGVVGLAVWSAVVTVRHVLRLPSLSLRLEPGEWRWLRIFALAALAASWAYLLLREG